MDQVLRDTGTEDHASAERSGLSPNPSPPTHRRTVTRNQISYQLTPVPFNSLPERKSAS